MTARKKDVDARERRKYIRLDSVFPVQFQMFDPEEDNRELTGWLQGFTNNIGKGGICLRFQNTDPQFAALIGRRAVRFHLEIEVPFRQHTIRALASISWVKQVPENPVQYLLGLNYESIDVASGKRLMRYVRVKKALLPSLVTLLCFAGLVVALNTYISIKLIKGNKALVDSLVRIIQEMSVAKQKIKVINNDKDKLQLGIETLQLRIQDIEHEKASLLAGAQQQEAKATRKISELNETIKQLAQEKEPLEAKLLVLEKKHSMITEELLRLDQKKAVLAKANFDKMYRWLAAHQNPRTGLVMSFEGDNDVEDWAFIYDQSLALQAFNKFSDFERCRRILDFFGRKAKRQNNLYYNAYFVDDGSPVEYAVHCGPNIWLGIAVVQYTHKTRDTSYLYLAEDIARAIIALQDGQGGIKGGPAQEWYSTEHNLDAYAFFDMLFQVTANPLYRQKRDMVLDWLVEHTYDQHQVPVIRGKGDATIATDTYAWSLAAIGPEKLAALNMNPESVLEFAEQHCAVKTVFNRPEGASVEVKGFDFAAQQNVARGGVVSSEWTAQMVIAYKILSAYFYKQSMVAKARTYELKADDYLVNLCSMIISSPSPSGQGEGCLPYASIDFVDTGHGWRTPKGRTTGSVAGTAYTLFAYYNYNPLSLQE